MLKNKTSLIIVCVFIGILICYFTMCNCRMNYNLIEGLATTTTPTTMPAGGTVGSRGSAAPLTNPVPIGVNKPSTNPMAPGSGPGSIAPPAPAPPLKAPIANAKKLMGTPTETFKKEGFQLKQPIEFASLKESKSDDWNLSKWVKDAMRYAKGMGNENRLDSYQYNSGPPIPLPEGELFFFKDTKFSPDCCPGTYSSSLGCACLSKPQFNYLVTRGGNNTVPTGRKTAYYNEY